MSARQLSPGLYYQGDGETIAYKLNFAAWGAGPFTDPVNTLRNLATDEDVSVANLTGAPEILQDGVTFQTSGVTALEPGVTYRLEASFSFEGNVLEGWLEIAGED